MTMETTKRKYTMTMETTKRKYTRKNPRQAADTLFRVWIKSKSKFYVHGFGHKSSWAYQAKADEMARAAGIPLLESAVRSAHDIAVQLGAQSL